MTSSVITIASGLTNSKGESSELSWTILSILFDLCRSEGSYFREEKGIDL